MYLVWCGLVGLVMVVRGIGCVFLDVCWKVVGRCGWWLCRSCCRDLLIGVVGLVC